MIRRRHAKGAIIASLAVSMWVSGAWASESETPPSQSAAASPSEDSTVAPPAISTTPPAAEAQRAPRSAAPPSAAAPVLADPNVLADPKTMPDGLFASLSIGLGGGQGVHHAPNTTGAVSDAAGISAGEIALHLAVGSAAGSGLGLGGELGAILLAPIAQQGSFGGAKLGPFGVRFHVGPFVDFYPRRESRLHLQMGLGGAAQFLGYATPVTQIEPPYEPSFRKVTPPHTMFGGAGYLGVACDLERKSGGAGLFLRTYVGYFVDSDAYFVPLDAVLGATFSWF